MKNQPVKKERNETQPFGQSFVQPFFQNPFINFTYSSISVSSFNGKTEVKAEKQSFENGVFESKRFEGTTHENIYGEIIKNIQKQLHLQMEMFFKTFLMSPPFRGLENHKIHKSEKSQP